MCEAEDCPFHNPGIKKTKIKCWVSLFVSFLVLSALLFLFAHFSSPLNSSIFLYSSNYPSIPPPIFIYTFKSSSYSLCLTIKILCHSNSMNFSPNLVLTRPNPVLSLILLRVSVLCSPTPYPSNRVILNPIVGQWIFGFWAGHCTKIHNPHPKSCF